MKEMVRILSLSGQFSFYAFGAFYNRQRIYFCKQLHDMNEMCLYVQITDGVDLILIIINDCFLGLCNPAVNYLII